MKMSIDCNCTACKIERRGMVEDKTVVGKWRNERNPDFEGAFIDGAVWTRMYVKLYGTNAKDWDIWAGKAISAGRGMDDFAFKGKWK